MAKRVAFYTLRLEIYSINMKKQYGKKWKSKNRWKVVIVWKIKKIKRKKPLLYLHYGCKVNQYETNAIAQKFIEKGYEKVEFEDKADIYLINTCTVTSMADKKSRQIIRQAKSHNENSIVVATGCYAEVSKAELEKVEELDIIVRKCR